MKKIAILIAITSFFIFIPRAEVNAQCKEQRVYHCARLGGNAIYLRDFNTKLKAVRSERDINGTKWPVVLNRGTRYRFILCEQTDIGTKEVKLTLFDTKNPETDPINSTEKTGSEMFDFVCQRSGVYYVSIRFMDGKGKKQTCAVGILSFVGKNQ
jgi:hypothetical protein